VAHGVTAVLGFSLLKNVQIFVQFRQDDFWIGHKLLTPGGNSGQYDKFIISQILGKSEST
jgi:hypothetical protein